MPSKGNFHPSGQVCGTSYFIWDIVIYSQLMLEIYLGIIMRRFFAVYDLRFVNIYKQFIEG